MGTRTSTRQFSNAGAARSEVHHASEVTVCFDDVADLDSLFRQQDQTADEIVHESLRPKADADGKRTAKKSERREGDAEPVQCREHHEHEKEVENDLFQEGGARCVYRMAPAEIASENPRERPGNERAGCETDHAKYNLTHADPAHPRHHGAVWPIIFSSVVKSS